jgi:glycosyltransferase involved in cell wall biosynthesis
MRVLVTNAALESWAGSELYARDVARALRRRGHEAFLFSPFLGPLAETLRGEGFAVVDDLAALPAAPDLIHGQHHTATLAAIAFFRSVPAVYFCHGALPWEEIAPRHPLIRGYVAVSESVAEHLVRGGGFDPGEIEIIHNFVDVDRFPLRDPLPARPRRALVFGNYVGESPALAAIREACGHRGIAVDAYGRAAGLPISAPEKVLGDYDVVFGIGRSALEAMATGTAVVLCNTEGLGELVTPAAFEALRRGNFGRAILTRPATAEAIAAELRRYDPGAAAALARRVRKEMALEKALDRIVALYERVLAAPVAVLRVEEERDALHGYLRWLARAIRDRLQTPLRAAEQAATGASARAEAAEERAGRRVPREALAAAIERAEAAERQVRTLAARGEALEAWGAELETRARTAQERAAGAERREAAVADWARGIETSVTWRVARALRRLPGILPLVRATLRMAAGGAAAPPEAPLASAASAISDGPELACVVLCHRGAPEVVEAVASLAAQDVACEIVVVNSEGESPEPRLRAAGLNVPVVHRYRRLLPGAARNLGVAATAAPYVAFLAADCVAEPGWGRARLARHQAGASLVASSIVNADPRSSAALAAYMTLFARRMPGTPAASALLYGVSYSRALLVEVGPFREDLRAGEDTEHLERAAVLARPVWAPEVRTAHHHPRSVAALVREQRARGARAARAYSRLNGLPEGGRVARDALGRWLPALWLALRSAGWSGGWRLLPALVLTPAAATAYAWGAWRGDRGPDPDAPTAPFRVYALCAFRDEARFLPGLLENLAGAVDGLLALDDGSTDGSAELVAAHPLTVGLLRRERAADGSWDEAGNQRALIEAAWETDADWLIAIDADERLEIGFRRRAQEAISRAGVEGLRAYWVHIRELWDRPDTYRVDGVWGRKGHLRFFVNSRDHAFDTAELHRHWGPVDARVDGQFVPADILVFHLRMLREEDRRARRDRYMRLDPDRRWQSIGYEYLTETEGLQLEPLAEGRGYVPLADGDLQPVVDGEGLGKAAVRASV